eukprot:TRINITY_DN5064_c0_g1_i1.p1 TRINITY_DN5064_c0_g1~~TRINITY_DN5064_c0_g1_i1.p1  ORF type:complete len:287 (+),score=132.42 TRINITY_DN5064_c0_g1_i1:414-1274(+)
MDSHAIQMHVHISNKDENCRNSDSAGIPAFRERKGSFRGVENRDLRYSRFAARKESVAEKSADGADMNLVLNGDPSLVELHHDLIRAERFNEAMACMDYIQKDIQAKKLESEYDKAKNEDRLEDAISLRSQLKTLHEQLSEISRVQLEIWNSPSDEMSLKELSEKLLELLGTKASMDFIAEFSDLDLCLIAKTDLPQASALKQKAVARFEEIKKSDPQAEGLLLDARRKEEEERWKREKKERKEKRAAKKKEMMQVFVKQRSKTMDSPSPADFSQEIEIESDQLQV